MNKTTTIHLNTVAFNEPHFIKLQHLINGSDWAGIGINEKKQKLIVILEHPEQLT